MKGIDVWFSFTRCSWWSVHVLGAAPVSTVHDRLGQEKRASTAA